MTVLKDLKQLDEHPLAQKQRQTKMADYVDISELEPLFNLLRNNGINENRALGLVGFKSASSTLNEIRKIGLVKRVTLYAIKGLVAEKQKEFKIGGEVAKTETEVLSLDFDETVLAFDLAKIAKPAVPKRAPQVQKLMGKLAMHMARLGG